MGKQVVDTPRQGLEVLMEQSCLQRFKHSLKNRQSLSFRGVEPKPWQFEGSAGGIATERRTPFAQDGVQLVDAVELIHKILY